jgi:hypothetical protein
MPSNQPIPQPDGGCVGSRDVVPITFYNKVVLGSSGAVDTTNTSMARGVTVAKTASENGRYTITLPKNFFALLDVRVAVITVDDASHGALTVALPWSLRDNDVGTGANDGTFEVQFHNASTNWTDDDLPDNLSFLLTIVVDRGM